jgi:hypothetical protein
MEKKIEKKPFGLRFVEAIPDAELEKITGRGRILTEALSISTHGAKDNTTYDQF